MFILVHDGVWEKCNLSQFADFIFWICIFFKHFLILKTELAILPRNPKQILRPPDHKQFGILYN